MGLFINDVTLKGEGWGEGVSASVTTYTLSIHQYETSYDEGEGGSK